VIDLGLLASMAVVLIVSSVFVRPWPEAAALSGFSDVTLGALLIGLIVGRVASVAIDDPGSLSNVSDLLIIRSGVEFWPGLATGLVWLAIRARHDHINWADRLAAISTPALVAWACYEGTCLLRDGCPGPVSSFGLRPDGLAQRMFPVGLVVAAAALGAASAIRHAHRRGMSSNHVVVLAVGALALIRSVASIWLPRVSSELTRQHRTSIAVATIASIGFVSLRVREGRIARSGEP
jgi:hypothetical protein